MREAHFRRCSNGHSNTLDKQFCTECGVALANTPPTATIREPFVMTAATSRTRRGLLAALIGVALLVAAVAVISSRNDGDTEASNEATGSTAPVSTTARGSAPANATGFSAYYSTDGATPAAFPDCNGIFGLCLNSPIEKATGMLGVEDERYAGGEDGSIGRTWEKDGMRIVVDADKVGSITSLSVAIDPESSPKLRVALPEKLVLGTATFAKVESAMGYPPTRDDFSAENTYFHVYSYQSGPEGTETLKFTHTVEGEAVPESALSTKLVDGFSVKY
jgi:hypothetical protein